jgi:mono/diheme cytochrome c family protein
MSGTMKYVACAAIIGFATQGIAIPVAPACEPCYSCHGGYTTSKSAPPPSAPASSSRTRWMTVYVNGWARSVPTNDRSGTSAPATPAVGTPAPATPAVGVPTSKIALISTGASPSGPAPSGPAQVGPANSASAPANGLSADRQDLANRAQALLRAKCAQCHGGTRQSSGLDLRSRDSILKGGASGPAVVPGQPDASLVLQRARAGEMPPNAGQLSSEEISTLQQWIAAGAPAENAQRR